MPSSKTAERWNRSLRCFRFHFAHGGHANDLDTLSARVRFTSGEAGLRDIFRRLQLSLRAIPPGAPRRETGKTYTTEEWRELPEPMRHYPDFAQPGFTKLFGAPVNISVYADWISIMVTGGTTKGFSWEVYEEDFQNALMLEKLLELHGVAFIID